MQSSEDFPNDVPVHVGETEISALETIGQAFVVEPDEVKQSCIEVVNVDWGTDDVETEFVCFAVDVSRLDSSAC